MFLTFIYNLISVTQIDLLGRNNDFESPDYTKVLFAADGKLYKVRIETIECHKPSNQLRWKTTS